MRCSQPPKRRRPDTLTPVGDRHTSAPNFASPYATRPRGAGLVLAVSGGRIRLAV